MQAPASNTQGGPIRAAGAAHREGKYVAGNFSTGAPAVLRDLSTKWKLYRDKPEPINPRRRQAASKQDPTPWLLADHAGNVTHKGQLEGGINPENYFILVKDEGSFTAIPLAAWYNFRPPPRRAAMSLEEAEAEMEKKHNSHFGGTGRLSQAIARNEAQGALDGGPDEGGAMGADSDEEERRANRARTANKDTSSAAEGRNQSAATDVNVVKKDKAAEDWEYEENAADDDEDMGEQDDANNSGDASPPARQSPATSQEDAEGEEGAGLSKHGQEVQRLLRKTGLSDSEEEDISNEDVKEDTSLMTDDDDDEEIEDLDAMATGMASGRPGPTPKAASAAETTANAGRKRSPTPTSGPSAAAGSKRKAEGSQPTAKRKRSATPSVKAEPMPAAASAVKSEATASAGVKAEPKQADLVSLQEMKEFIRSRGGSIPATQLTQQFKSRIVTTQQKEHFKSMVKTGLHFDKVKKSLDLKPEDR